MKLYTEEQVKEAIDLARVTLSDKSPYPKNIILSEIKGIQLPNDEEIFWNTENPLHIDNYIVHRGAEGVSLGWWNGKEWIEMWGSKKINVNGWIKIPNTPIEWMKEQIIFNTEEK